MDASRISRTATPIRGVRQGQPIGAWTAWMTLGIFAVATSTLLVSHVYLYWGQDVWPPPGYQAPALLRATIAMVLVVVGGALTFAALRAMRAGRERTSGHILFAAALVLAGCLTALIVDMTAAPWLWDEHVYTSLFWLNAGYAALFVAMSLLMLLALVIQRVAGVLDAERHLELQVVTILMIHTVAVVAVAYIMAYLLPHR